MADGGGDADENRMDCLDYSYCMCSFVSIYTYRIFDYEILC